ncbi:MAG: hypothetical protein OWQ54_04930 [Sulfolobaceae archaeon]|nr:hypothetical protein [Sulfolobaceae archaeon]
MFGHLLDVISYQILNELSKGRKTIDELKSSITAYGVVFDYAISYLLTYGLAKRVTEGGKEYLELTDLGKSVLNWMAAPMMPPHWHGRRHGWYWW